jgi:mono/diheme cytochrome c family protein
MTEPKHQEILSARAVAAVGLCLAVLPALFGCALPYDMGYDTAALAGGDPASGQAIYDQSCASCHGYSGEGSAAGSTLAGNIDTLSDSRIWSVIVYGTDGMPAYPDLSDQEIGDVIAYMRAAF